MNTISSSVSDKTYNGRFVTLANHMMSQGLRPAIVWFKAHESTFKCIRCENTVPTPPHVNDKHRDTTMSCPHCRQFYIAVLES